MKSKYRVSIGNSIMTINHLEQISTHNKRDKKYYQSNSGIKLKLSKDNIELVSLKEKVTKFDKNNLFLTKWYTRYWFLWINLLKLY